MPPFRRFLIAAGTARYDHLPKDQQLPSVSEDIALIVSCFTARGYEHVLADVSQDPTAGQLREALGEWFMDGRTASDHVVFYYSGHGEIVEGDGHYLACRDTRYREGRLLSARAFGDEEIAKAIVGSPVQHALIILDTCFSTAGLLGFSQKAAGLFPHQHWKIDLPHGIHLIAAAHQWQKAEEGAFSVAFCDALANRDGKLGGPLTEFFRPEEVVGAVNTNGKMKPSQKAQHLCPTPRADAIVQLLPNPRFEPGRPAGLTLAEHWIPKALGGSLDSRAWYFTGRERALRELVTWLDAPQGDGKARVVTGSAGSGKSALLARLVLLSDPESRARAEAAGALAIASPDTVPSPGCIDLRVHARGKTLTEVAAEIGQPLGVSSGRPSDIVARLKADAERFTLVVDALDEAKEPAKIARELLRPIAPIPAVRLLLGSRPDVAGQQGGRRFVGLGQSTVELDLDSPDYLGESDLEDYLTRRLLAAEEPDRPTPYRSRGDLARPVAKEVADRCGRLFLVARLLADGLLAAQRPLSAEEAAAIVFPKTVGAAFEAYLQRFDEDGDLGTDAAVDLLRPLAYAEGAGLPFGRIWPALATALAGREYLDHDIDQLHQRAGSFVIESLEDGQSVYRLYHEALAEHLRGGRGFEQDQRTLAQALVSLVPARPDGGKDWLKADPYVRAHLAAHAASGGMLEALTSDPLYLVAAERRGLLRALRQPAVNASGQVYECSFHNLDAADPGERLAYLEMAAHHNGEDAFLERSAAVELDRPWRAAWANWSAAGAHREIARLRGAIVGLLTLELDGRSLVIVATYYREGLRDDAIRYSELLAYDVADGSPHFDSGHLSTVTLTAIALAESSGEPIVVATTSHGSIQRWRVRDGAMLGEPVDVQRPGMEVCDLDHLVTGMIDGHSCAAFSARSVVDLERVMLLDLWDLETGAPILEEPIRLGDVPVVGLAMVSEPPFEVLISGDSERVRLWDLGTGDLLEESEPLDRLNALAARADGDVIRIVIGSGTSIQVWSAFDDGLKLAHAPHAGHSDGVACLALARLGDEDVILSGGREGYACVWRLSDSGSLFDTRVRFSGLPTHVALARHSHRAEVVTADSSRALLAWRISTDTPAHATPERTLPHCGWVARLSVVETKGGPCVATHSRGRAVRAWNAETGVPWPGSLGDAAQSQSAMTAGLVSGRLSLFTCDRDGQFLQRDETGATRALDRVQAGQKAAAHLALVHDHESDYLVSVDADGVVAVQDASTDRVAAQFECGMSFGGLRFPWSGISVVTGEAGPLLVTYASTASTFSIWTLPAGNQAWNGLLGAGKVMACACARIAGRPLLLASHEGKGLLLWDLESHRLVHEFGFETPRAALALAELDGQRFAAGVDHDSRLHVWRGEERIVSLQTDCTVQGLAFVLGPGIIVAGCEGMMLVRLR